MPKMFQHVFWPLLKNWDGIPSQKVDCDGNSSQFSVANDYWDRKLWPISITICDGQFFRPSQNLLWLWSSSFQNCDRLSVTISVATSVTIVNCPSQFLSQTDCDGNNSVTIFPSQIIVTDDFPSQLHLWPIKLWRTIFRHNFNFSVTISGIFHHKFRHKLQLFP